MRVCRYKIVGEVQSDYKEPVLYTEAPEAPALATGPELRPVAADAERTAPVASQAPQKVKHPSKAKYAELQLKAKAQSKGFIRYAQGPGKLRLLPGCDGSARMHWSVI